MSAEVSDDICVNHRVCHFLRRSSFTPLVAHNWTLPSSGVRSQAICDSHCTSVACNVRVFLDRLLVVTGLPHNWERLESDEQEKNKSTESTRLILRIAEHIPKYVSRAAASADRAILKGLGINSGGSIE